MNNPEIENSSFTLAIETSGRVGSAVLAYQDTILEEVGFSGKMRHSSELFPSLNRLIQNHDCSIQDIQMLIFSCGPGSFTGLRIAVTTAKMFAFANRSRLVAVNTLDSIAENAIEYIKKDRSAVERIGCILDAKQNLFYTGIYTLVKEQWTRQVEDLLTPDGFISKYGNDPTNPIALLGEGLTYYKDKFTGSAVTFLPPEYWPAKASSVFNKGLSMAKSGEYADPAALVPHYIRKPEPIEKVERK